MNRRGSDKAEDKAVCPFPWDFVSHHGLKHVILAMNDMIYTKITKITYIEI
jgi:hypothetical protein